MSAVSAIYADFHPDTIAYHKRVLANGGVISARSLGVVDRMVCRWAKAGILPILRQGIELPFAGSNLSAALTPLVLPFGLCADFF
jgi:hypothetical protein